jgi:hypothetical protein
MEYLRGEGCPGRDPGVLRGFQCRFRRLKCKSEAEWENHPKRIKKTIRGSGIVSAPPARLENL